MKSQNDTFANSGGKKKKKGKSGERLPEVNAKRLQYISALFQFDLQTTASAFVAANMDASSRYAQCTTPQSHTIE